MTRTVTVVLPVEAESVPTAVAARRIDSFSGGAFGIVDNGLWSSMRVFADLWAEHVRTAGGTGIEVVPFDHLSVDFIEQQRALGPFARRVRGVVAGLGN